MDYASVTTPSPKCPTCQKETQAKDTIYMDATCIICYEENTTFQRLGCGHCFCKECCERID